MKTPLLLAGLLIFLLSSCNHYYYSTNDLYLARVSQPRDFKVSGGIAGQSGLFNGERIEQRTVSAAFSPLRYLALAGRYVSVRGERGQDPTLAPFGGGRMRDVAIGGYYPLSGPERKVDVLVDLYAGYARGEAENFYEDFSSSRVTFERPSLQLGLHVAHRDLFSLSVGWRASRLGYRSVIFSPSTNAEERPAELTYLIVRSPFRVNAFGVKLQAGPRYAKTYLSFTTANAINAPDLEFLNRVFTIGLTVEIDEFFRREGR